MPDQYTYPGVYPREVSSGVRTIAGVSTSTALFVARAVKGPLNQAVRCLNLSDFERTFSFQSGGSELPDAVKLFYNNGGTTCYVVRIANGATQASVRLRNIDASLEVLEVKAKDGGAMGNDIRMAVTYSPQNPYTLFNIEVFRASTNRAGQVEKLESEMWSGLSMDPGHPRYVEKFITRNSKLIECTGLPGAVPSSLEGYSQSGRLLRIDTPEHFREDLGAILTNGQRFNISVNGGALQEVDLSSLDLTVGIAAILLQIETRINNLLPATAQVTVSNEDGFTLGAASAAYLRISSSSGDVRIEPSLSNDLSGVWMLGTHQGGRELSAYSNVRPAPNAMYFEFAALDSFAARAQTAFSILDINNTIIDLNGKLRTTAAPATMRQDGNAASVNGNQDGVREKMNILAKAINDFRLQNPTTFFWSAEVWGAQLAILPTKGDANATGALKTSGEDNVDIGADFTNNVRWYSLGASGKGTFHIPGLSGSDGTAPTLADYQQAFNLVEKQVDLFNLMVLPHDQGINDGNMLAILGQASIFCQQQRAFLLMDTPQSWANVQDATDLSDGISRFRIGVVKDHAAMYYPRVITPAGQNVGASGAIAGLMARTDANRGVWKAPAGTEADIRGIVGLEDRMNDLESGLLNMEGINALRVFPTGVVSWGARTMDGADFMASEWKYIPVRRTALFIEEALYRGLQWAVFEPNDHQLWSQIRLNVGAFMHNLFRQGAFQGATKQDAYFVKCDEETTTQNDINLGIVNIWVGFAPLKPAEFVVLNLQQMTGQIQI